MKDFVLDSDGVQSPAEPDDLDKVVIKLYPDLIEAFKMLRAWRDELRIELEAGIDTNVTDITHETILSERERYETGNDLQDQKTRTAC